MLCACLPVCNSTSPSASRDSNSPFQTQVNFRQRSHWLSLYTVVSLFRCNNFFCQQDDYLKNKLLLNSITWSHSHSFHALKSRTWFLSFTQTLEVASSHETKHCKGWKAGTEINGQSLGCHRKIHLSKLIWGLTKARWWVKPWDMCCLSIVPASTSYIKPFPDMWLFWVSSFSQKKAC